MPCAIQPSLQVIREKSLLQQSSHPYILAYIASYQDDDALHLLFEFCAGGELLHLLQRSPLGVLPEADAAFYLGGIALALEHLHDRGAV